MLLVLQLPVLVIVLIRVKSLPQVCSMMPLIVDMKSTAASSLAQAMLIMRSGPNLADGQSTHYNSAGDADLKYTV